MTIELNDTPPGISIGTKQLKLISHMPGLEYVAECKISDLAKVLPQDYPNALWLDLSNDQQLNIPNLILCLLGKEDDKLELSFSVGVDDGVWKERLAFTAFCKELMTIQQRNTAYSYWREASLEPEESHLSITASINEDEFKEPLGHIIGMLSQNLIKLIEETERAIFGFSWDSRFNSDEEFFTKELLIPLLRKMDFDDVRYNHGPKEYGRDILFSEFTKFAVKRRYAVQVKAGNVSGGNSSLVDTIVSQINDAFAMPVRGPGLSKQFRISDMLVIISGKFSDNAIEKINSKLNDVLIGSVNFLDRDDVEWLVRKHWPL